MLDLIQSFEFLKELNIAPFEIINKTNLVHASSKIGFPCFLKLSTPRHKVKLGVLKHGIDYSQLHKEFTSLSKKFQEGDFIIQKQVKGTELTLGIKTDPVFNKLVMFGLGGSLVEILKT